MVVMFVDCCVRGGRYFPYYSYRRNPTGREFFVPARTLIAVKLLSVYRSIQDLMWLSTTDSIRKGFYSKHDAVEYNKDSKLQHDLILGTNP
jgi:hypothetical protein